MNVNVMDETKLFVTLEWGGYTQYFFKFDFWIDSIFTWFKNETLLKDAQRKVSWLI